MFINKGRRPSPSFQQRYAQVLRTAATATVAARVNSKSLMHGMRRSRKEGGRESPVGRRRWEPGDPVSMIDWAATKINVTGELERRVDLTLRRTPMVVAVEASPSMLFGGGFGLTKIQHAAALAVSLIRSACANGDPVQVSIFDRSKLIGTIAPNHPDHLVKQTVTTLLKQEDRLLEEERQRARDRRPLRMLTRWLSGAWHKKAKAPTGSGLALAMRRIPFSTPGQLFLISDCIWWGEEERKALQAAASYHQARCLLVVDPSEAELPRFNWHWHQFAEMGTGAISSVFVTRRARRRHRQFFQAQLDATVALLRRLNCTTAVSSTVLDRTGILKLLNKLALHG